jgi:hypothetical protein
MCVRVQGVHQRQLFRQMMAFALNCVMSGASADCDALLATASACDTLCASGLDDDGVANVHDCIDAIDCFNNGGNY